MYAYELLPKLRYLTLAGQDEEGNLEWIGTAHQWRMTELEEELHEQAAKQDLSSEHIKEEL